MDKHFLDQIEQQYHVVYPSLYRQLYLDGMLDVIGEKRPHWYKNHFEDQCHQPTFNFFGQSFELLTLEEVTSECADLFDPHRYTPICSEYHFIPFARNGAGDLYCFFMNDPHRVSVPIVLLMHDSLEAIYLAKDLTDFLFMELLSCVLQFDEYSSLGLVNYTQNLQNILKTHAPYLSASRVAILREIYARELVTFMDVSYKTPKPYVGLLCADEYKAILAREQIDLNLGASFSYVAPEPVDLETKRFEGIVNLVIHPFPSKNEEVNSLVKKLNWHHKNQQLGRLYIKKSGIVIGRSPTLACLVSSYRDILVAILKQEPHAIIRFHLKDSNEVIDWR